MSPRRRRWLLAEYLLLFYGLVGGYALASPPGSPILPLLLLAPPALHYLRRRAGLGRRVLLGLRGLRGDLVRIVALWAAVAALTVAVIAATDPGRLFHLPREEPLLWAAIVVLYPLLSVYPQELIFRGFLQHRYAPAFGDGAGVAAAGAVAFGFAHIIFGSWLSVLLTVLGGWLFARRYQRTGSLMAAAVEHALYGILAFTVGLDQLFYDDGTGS